jgi:uncharacterized protein (TIGR03067 family)
MDVTATDGPMKGKIRENTIYELDGDTLKICIDKRVKGGGRPTDFKTAPGDGCTLFVLKRVKEEAKDEDRLQGLWQAESMEAEGRKTPAADVEKFQVRFKGDKITYLPDDRTHTFELDAKAKPKAMNITPGDGTDKGKKLECAIYELDGDTLKICMDKEGMAGKRPTEFKTAAKDGHALMVFKRVKEKD